MPGIIYTVSTPCLSRGQWVRLPFQVAACFLSSVFLEWRNCSLGTNTKLKTDINIFKTNFTRLFGIRESISMLCPSLISPSQKALFKKEVLLRYTENTQILL